MLIFELRFMLGHVITLAFDVDGSERWQLGEEEI